jgi:hypothetical protein
MKNREELIRRGRIVFYRLVNVGDGSRKRCLGYELAITQTETGKINRSWFYDASELRWAKHGFRALIDAQSRQVLNRRERWKAYSGRARVG